MKKILRNILICTAIYSGSVVNMFGCNLPGYVVSASEAYQEEETSIESVDEEIYSQVIQQYQDAIAHYRATGEYLIKEFFLTKEFLVTNDSGLEPWYGFYDVDGNGVDELFLGYETIDGVEWKIVDVYTCRDTGIWRLGDQGTFSQYCGSFVHEDGTICISSSVAYIFCKIAEDGYTLVPEESYSYETTYIDEHTEPVKTYYNDEETLTQDELQEKIDALGDLVEINWKKIDLQTDASQNAEENIEIGSITGVDAYDNILQRYYEGITSGWSIQEFNENGLCYLAGYNLDFDQTGYCLLDVDQNGIEELIVGMNIESYNGIVYEIYTVLDGELECILSSGERDRYYLCEDNVIANEGSSSAFLSVNYYYDYKSGKLSLQDGIVYDEDIDPQNPWFYGTLDNGEDSLEPISEGAADSIKSKYKYMKLSFSPLSDAQ